jgi:Family of unknown function (DUF5681)
MSRTADGKFAKGTSGNPGGRPKLPEELKAGLQALSDEAVKVLHNSLQSDDERVRILAAVQILDRGYGKPAQTVNARFENVDLSAAQLNALQSLTRKPAALAIDAVVIEDEEQDLTDKASALN